MSSIQHIVKEHAITTAQSVAQRGKDFRLPDEIIGLTMVGDFVYSGGGTTAIAYLQTTYDDKVTWFDIMSLGFTTASAKKVLKVHQDTPIVATATLVTDALTVNTAVSGIIGKHARVRVVTTGTYTGTNTLDIRVRLEHGNN